MKILWLDLNSSYAHSSLALPAIHAQIKDNSTYEWTKVSATTNDNASTIAGLIYKQKPDIIAATCWLFTHEALLHILSRCKTLLPKAIIILGGPEFLGKNDKFLNCNRFINCVLRGEGEEIFPKWLEVANDIQKWNNINGLCYINETSEYIDNGIAKVSNFSKLINPEESKFFNWTKPFVQLETTRGCFNTCAFCVSGREKPIRNLPIEKIRERIENIYSHGIKNIRILDRTFNYNTNRAKELFSIFKDYEGKIKFHLEIHPAIINDELKKEISNMPYGLLHLEAGIQSLHQDVLTACKRNGTLEASLNGLKFLCSLKNIETHTDLIAGLPLYHLNQIFEDILTLSNIGTGEIQLESLKLLPGTEMRILADNLGIKHSQLPPYEVLCTNEITNEELQIALQLSRLIDGYYNTSAWQNITRLLIKNEHNFLNLFLNYLRDKNVIDQPLSLENRGILLYEFCKQHFPKYSNAVTIAWVEAGMSLKKKPAEHILTKRYINPETLKIIYGTYNKSLRMSFLPNSLESDYGIWFGHSSDKQEPKPVLKAIGPKQ